MTICKLCDIVYTHGALAGIEGRTVSFPVPGCRCKLFSLHPLYTQADLVFVPEITGTWRMEDDETMAARAVFKRCATAYVSGNITEAKTFVSRAALAEMERSGQVDMALGMLSDMTIDDFQAHREGGKITFKQSQKQGDATMSMSFTMVKEDNQWKLGN